MTPASLLHFAEALLWCALLFLSLAGYGAILLRLFGLRRPSIALAATVGVPVVLLLGGCLNLAHAITSPILIALSLFGIIAALLLRIPLANSKPEDEAVQPPHSRAATLLLCLAALLFAIRLGATVHAGQYQASDDYNFYLAAPSKMLELHHYAADPFSERRIMSSIGGNYFLQDMVLAVLPLEDVQMADRALGLFLLAFLVFDLAREFRLTSMQQAIFALLVVFTPQLQFNLTFVLLPSALFFGLVSLAANRKLLAQHPALLALLLGAVTGAVAAMKSTYLPHGVLFAGCLALFYWRRRGLASGLKTLLLAALGAFVVMAPWMIASHSASGTFFYPSLGPGYQYSAYGLYPAPSGAGISIILHKVVPFCLPLLLLFLVEWILWTSWNPRNPRNPWNPGNPRNFKTLWNFKTRGERDEQSEAILALSAAAFGAALLVGIATGGDSVRRYNYPCMLPAILLLYVVFSRRANAVFPAVSQAVTPAISQAVFKTRRWLILQTCTVLLIVLAAVSIWRNKLTNEFLQIPWGLKSALLDTPIVPPSVHDEYAAMQRALPDDAGTLATVGNSFLLDFRAHSIDIADYPGAASLPPGWPSRQNGEALAQYLLAHHLRYLVYNYADFAGFDEGAPHVIADPSRTQWIHSEARIALRSHQQYAELARTRRRLYDDGSMYILDLATESATDLATPATGPNSEGPSNQSLTEPRKPR